MKIEFDYIDAIRQLINVPSVTSLVDFIRPFENIPSDYTDKKKFIVLSLSDDGQTVNVNINVPDLANDYGADVATLRQVTNAVAALVNQTINGIAFYCDMIPSAEKSTVGTYHYCNIAVKSMLFDKSITVYGLQNVPDPDGYGNGTETQVLKFSANCNMELSESQSLFLQGNSVEVMTYKLTYDYSENMINKGDTVVWNGFDLLAMQTAKPDDQERFLTANIVLQRA